MSSSSKLMSNSSHPIRHLDQAGAVDEETFSRSFEDVPAVRFSSPKELEEELKKIKEGLLEHGNSDWQKRVTVLKRIRSLVIAGAHESKEFQDFLKLCELYFISCVKDLRSQVVREACVTISYLSLRLGIKSARFCETLLPILINLIPNSAKIMSSSAIVAIRFILANTRSPRLIPIIISNMGSKSREIRKSCCEFLDQMLHTWSTPSLEKHALSLQDAIKKGISDADPEARQFARKAFWGFADHFKRHADSILQSLDPGKQRVLHEEHQTIRPTENGKCSTEQSKVDGPSVSSIPATRAKQPTLSSRKATPVTISQPIPSSTAKKLVRSSSSLSGDYYARAKVVPSWSSTASAQLTPNTHSSMKKAVNADDGKLGQILSKPNSSSENMIKMKSNQISQSLEAKKQKASQIEASTKKPSESAPHINGNAKACSTPSPSLILSSRTRPGLPPNVSARKPSAHVTDSSKKLIRSSSSLSSDSYNRHKHIPSSSATLERTKPSRPEPTKTEVFDDDPEARRFARKALYSSADHFKKRTDSILQSIDNILKSLEPSTPKVKQEITQKKPSENGTRPNNLSTSHHNGHLNGLTRMDCSSLLSTRNKQSVPFHISSNRKPLTSNNSDSSKKLVRSSSSMSSEYTSRPLPSSNWSSRTLDRNTSNLHEAVKREIKDVDIETSQLTRQAFLDFADHFQRQTQSILESFEPEKPRLSNEDKFAEKNIQSSYAINDLNRQGKEFPKIDSTCANSPKVSSRLPISSADESSLQLLNNSDLLTSKFFEPVKQASTVYDKYLL